MPLEAEPPAEISAAVEPSPLDTFGGGEVDFPPLPFEDSFPFPLPMLLLLLLPLLLLLLNTCVTLSMTLPLMMIPILEAALRDDEAAEAAAEWAEGGAALGVAPPWALGKAGGLAAAAAAAAVASFPLSLSASAAAAAADSGEGRELGFEGGGCVAGLLRLNPSEVILLEISFEARSTTPGVLVVLVELLLLLLLVTGMLLAEPVLLLPPLVEVVEPGLPLFIVLSGRQVNHPSATDDGQSQKFRENV